MAAYDNKNVGLLYAYYKDSIEDGRTKIFFNSEGDSLNALIHNRLSSWYCFQM